MVFIDYYEPWFQRITRPMAEQKQNNANIFLKLFIALMFFIGFSYLSACKPHINNENVEK